MEKIFLLVYSSKATEVVDSNYLNDILSKACTRNLEDKITGFLISRQGYFVQLLEGPEDKVRECFQRIKKDPRHTNVTILAEAYENTRITPKWSMGHVEYKEGQISATELLELFDCGRNGTIYTSKAPIELMLKKFAQDAKLL